MGAGRKDAPDIQAEALWLHELGGATRTSQTALQPACITARNPEAEAR